MPFWLVLLQVKPFDRARHHAIIAEIAEAFLAIMYRGFKAEVQVMSNTREPLITPIPILSLRPTQMTVGLREVKEKRKRWRETKSAKKQAKTLGKHMIPVVKGPDERYYVVDHHHLGARTARRRRQRHSGDRDRRSHHGPARCVLGCDGQQALGLSLRRQGRTPATSRICRSRSSISRTIRSAASPANCAAPAVSPRTPRRSANSCGPISCAAG